MTTTLTQLFDEQIRNDAPSHTDLKLRSATGSSQWYLEKDSGTHPIRGNNALEFFVCGEEGFRHIAHDICSATSSIDLVLWGFDPAMEIVRHMTAPEQPATGPFAGTAPAMALARREGLNQWPRGTTFGDLLADKATKGQVKVRMLVWFNNTAANQITGNLPDFPYAWFNTSFSPVHEPAFRAPSPNLYTARSVRLGMRSDYASRWWKIALSGGFGENLEVRLRPVHGADIVSSLGRNLPQSWARMSSLEKAGMTLFGTHHQKPVLIDYDPKAAKGKPPETCVGYVMGLNSVTGYWDTAQHLYNDMRREVSDKSDLNDERRAAWHVKPYRDYAIRVRGEALHEMNENFVQGWDRAGADADQKDQRNASIASGGAYLPVAQQHRLEDERKHIQPKDIPRPQQGPKDWVQIIRTQPEKQDATILKAYTLATSNAVNYIYVENQYFQLIEWSELIGEMRQRYLDLMSKSGKKLAEADWLYLFIVIPQPERDEMVPNTYDTLGGLGQGQGMGHYDAQVQGRIKDDAGAPPPRYPVKFEGESKAAFDQRADAYNKQMAERQARSSSVVGDSAQRAQAHLNLKTVLSTDLKVKVLTAMLLSYDQNNEASHIRISERDNAAETKRSAQEEAYLRNEAQSWQAYNDPKREKGKWYEAEIVKPKHGGRASDVDLAEAKRRKYDIIPPRYREIYIHSKLMMVDDVYTTLGSANLNARSMAGDSEFNLCTAGSRFTHEARKRVWGNLAGADLDGGAGIQTPARTGLAYEAWLKRMNRNKDGRPAGNPPEKGSFIHPFEDPREAPSRRLS